MWKVIMVTPYEQGVFRGESEAESIRHTLDEMARLQNFFEIPKKGSSGTGAILKYIPKRYREEMKGIAEGSGFPEEKIFALNSLFIILMSFWEGCTSFLVPKTHTENGSNLLMKNRDLGYRRLNPQVCTYSKLDGLNAFIGVVNGGSINWYQGMNEKKLVVFNNYTPSPKFEEGIPIPVLLRRMLEECDDVEGALGFIKKNKINGGSNIFLGDSERTVVVEQKSGHPPHIWSIKKPNCRANHYLFHDNPKPVTERDYHGKQQTLTRYERGKQLLAECEKIGVSKMQEFSRDHAHGPGSYSICRHKAFIGTPMSKLLSSSTISSQIFDLSERPVTYVALGQPCSSDFYTIKFGDEIPEELKSGNVWLNNLKSMNG
jgi:predicted choloylglycine hydrolase